MSEEGSIMSGGDINVAAIIKQVEAGQETMALWTDNKKVDFCRIFHDRTEAAKYILLATAREVARTALSRKFVSQKKISEVYKGNSLDYNWHLGVFGEALGYRGSGKIGGRATDDLEEIAKLRAQEIVKEMPIMKEAVKVIAPDVAIKIEKRDKLKEKGQTLFEQLQKYESPLYLSDYPEMKIGDFIEMLKTRTKEMRKILDQCNDIGEEGAELEAFIDKALFRGLPGLDEAIIEIIRDHIERAKAMDQFDRRVEEKVKFGDSEAATSLLQEFEKDEQEISSKIKGQFQTALQKLQLYSKSGKGLKALQAKKG